MTQRVVHQLVIGAAPGDAVTSMALHLSRELPDNIRGDLFALHLDPSFLAPTRRIHELDDIGPEDLVVYHASYGEPVVTKALLGLGRRLVLSYHNLTPAEFFLPDQPTFAAGLHWGRHELEVIRPLVLLALADSSFNAAELVALGYPDVRVAPVGLDPERLLRLPIRGSSLRRLEQHLGETPYFLSVAQLLPHKRVDVLLHALHLLQTVHGREVGLVLAGPGRIPAYTESLMQLARTLRLRNVWFAGSVEDAELATFMRGATAVVSASQHEGLGIPSIEAMAMGIPVVARAAGAVAETVGDGALLLPADAGPMLFAEAVMALLDDEGLRTDLAICGNLRTAQLGRLDATAECVALLTELLT